MKWLTSMNTISWTNVTEYYDPIFWEKLVLQVANEGKRCPMIATTTLNPLMSTYYELNPESSWVNFLLFLISEYPQTEHVAVFVSAMIVILNRHAVYYMLVLVLNALYLRNQNDLSIYGEIIAGLCDCIFFDIPKRWDSVQKYPITESFKNGNPIVHLVIYFYLVRTIGTHTAIE